MAKANPDPKFAVARLTKDHRDLKKFFYDIDLGEFDFIDDKSQFIIACLRFGKENLHLVKPYLKEPSNQTSLFSKVKTG